MLAFIYFQILLLIPSGVFVNELGYPPSIVPDLGEGKVKLNAWKAFNKPNATHTDPDKTTDDGGSPDPVPAAEPEVRVDPYGLPAGAMLGTCPADVEGQNYSLFVKNTSARRLGNNLSDGEGGNGSGSYVYYCMPEGGELGGGEPIVISVSVEEFRRLPLAGSGIVIEPDRDDYVIHLPVIGLTDPSAQVLTTTILGINVAVRATPVEYAWDFGDGSQPMVTTDPGRSYPDQTVEHLYTELGEFTISLTTTWEGEFSIDGGATWLPINGTTTTTDTADPIRVEEHVPLLVNGDDT